MLKVCDKCGAKLKDDNVNFCDKCGAKVKINNAQINGGTTPIVKTVVCPKCGQSSPIGLSNCEKCGSSLENNTAEIILSYFLTIILSFYSLLFSFIFSWAFLFIQLTPSIYLLTRNNKKLKIHGLILIGIVICLNFLIIRPFIFI